MKLKNIFLLVTLGMAALHAQAQWSWIEKDGSRVFSDTPPSSEVAEKDIIKRPDHFSNQTAQPLAPPSATTEEVKTTETPKKEAPSAQDKELEAKKKKADEELAVKKQEEEKKIAAIRAENCTRAKKSLQQLDSGMRMAELNDKGERIIMDDKKKAIEKSRVQKIITSECK